MQVSADKEQQGSKKSRIAWCPGDLWVSIIIQKSPSLYQTPSGRDIGAGIGIVLKHIGWISPPSEKRTWTNRTEQNNH
jgi:hypothetical protein